MSTRLEAGIKRIALLMTGLGSGYASHYFFRPGLLWEVTIGLAFALALAIVMLENPNLFKFKRKVREQISAALKHDVLLRQGRTCALCPSKEYDVFDFHHKLQVSEGGGNEPENIVGLCPTCHAKAHRR